MYVFFNPNPKGNRVGDCTIRAISSATRRGWEETYIWLCAYGLAIGDMPSANAVWGAYLRDNGFTRHLVPDENGENYTIRDFCAEHQHGTYILALSGHVVCVKDGSYYDSWDSGDEIPVYYWCKRKNNE